MGEIMIDLLETWATGWVPLAHCVLSAATLMIAATAAWLGYGHRLLPEARTARGIAWFALLCLPIAILGVWAPSAATLSTTVLLVGTAFTYLPNASLRARIATADLLAERLAESEREAAEWRVQRHAEAKIIEELMVRLHARTAQMQQSLVDRGVV